MKKIDHTYKNFNIDKFLKLLKNFKSTSTHDFINNIIISTSVPRKDPNRGMRFLKKPFNPINVGKLGSSRSFLNKRDREYY